MPVAWTRLSRRLSTAVRSRTCEAETRSGGTAERTFADAAPFNVRNRARHLGASHSVITSFAGASLNVSPIFILSPLASSASPSRGGLLFPCAGQQSGRVHGPPMDIPDAMVVDTRRWARVHVACALGSGSWELCTLLHLYVRCVSFLASRRCVSCLLTCSRT